MGEAAGTAQLSVGTLLAEGSARLRASGSPSARLDAELLLGHVLGMGRAGLLAHPEAAVGPGQAAQYEAAVQRRESGEPVAYIRGLKEFYGLAFAVDRRALIPRPETERLVEIALDRLRAALQRDARPPGTAPIRVWDVGTGSGAIAVALAVECRRRGYDADVQLLATDSSADALVLATENAVAHGVADMIELRQADLTDLADVPAADLLVANLPYIPSALLPVLPVAASFEPVAALDGGSDGLAEVRRLLPALPEALAASGLALLEIGAEQEALLAEAVAASLPGWTMAIHSDLSGLPRVAELGRGSTA